MSRGPRSCGRGTRSPDTRGGVSPRKVREILDNGQRLPIMLNGVWAGQSAYTVPSRRVTSLPEGLARKGYEVEVLAVYRTEPAPPDPDGAMALVAARQRGGR
jgi:hypothetical protein